MHPSKWGSEDPWAFFVGAVPVEAAQAFEVSACHALQAFRVEAGPLDFPVAAAVACPPDLGGDCSTDLSG